MKKQRVILYDLETGPLVTYNWGLWEQNALGIIKDWELLSFSYKILGEKKVVCVSRNQFKDKTDKTITKKLWHILNEADITVAHNGLSYDKKKSNAKFLEHGLTPPSPSIMIDTLKVAKKHFKLSSNKLNDLAKLLGVGQKESTGGFKLWVDCLAGIRRAWRIMRRYNKKDVLLLERVYNKLLPWIDNHPRITSNPEACSNCAGICFQSRGTVITKVGEFRRFVCQKCGRWVRSRVGEKSDKPKYVGI